MKKINKIDSHERDQIAVLLASGTSLRLIAKQLKRSVSSISEEVKRNSVDRVYKAIEAQELSQTRNKRAGI